MYSKVLFFLCVFQIKLTAGHIFYIPAYIKYMAGLYYF